MNPDELAILRKPEVQDYIKQFGYEKGDLVYRNGYYGEIVYAPAGEDFVTIRFYMDNKKINLHFDEFLLIPDCISRDSERPERGIVGILAGMDKIVRLHINDRSTCVEITWTSAKLIYREYAETPRLALLKALLWKIKKGK